MDEHKELKWEKQTVTMKKVTEDVIAHINKLIQESSEQASVKGKRSIRIDTWEEPFKGYRPLGGPGDGCMIRYEMVKQLWLHRIIQALVDKRHLFELKVVNNYGYFIQA